MRRRFLEVIAVAAAFMAVLVLLKLAPVPVAGQAARPTATAGSAATTGPVAKTPWGEPDLQGIWTDEYMTPLQRSARYAGKEFFTDAERAALDKERAGIDLRPRQAGGTERDVAGAYSAVFMSVKPTGRRTSLVVDPPDGRIPPMTAELQKRLDEERAYRLALLQNTATCKNQDPACRPGARVAAPYPRGREFASAEPHPPAIWGLTRPLGGRDAGRRRHQFHPRGGFHGIPREPALGRTLDPHRSKHHRVRRHDRRCDDVDEAVDRQAGIFEAERAGESDLLRAPVSRGEPWLAGGARGRARHRQGVRRGTRPRPGLNRQRHRNAGARGSH